MCHVPFHDTTGVPSQWKSQCALMFPCLQHDQGPHRLLMFNYFLHEPQGLLLQDMCECTQPRKGRQDSQMDCGGAISPMLWGRSAQLCEPIHPTMDPFEFVGAMQTRPPWDVVMGKLFQDQSITGANIAPQMQDEALTHTVHEGGQTNFTCACALSALKRSPSLRFSCDTIVLLSCPLRQSGR